MLPLYAHRLSSVLNQLINVREICAAAVILWKSKMKIGSWGIGADLPIFRLDSPEGGRHTSEDGRNQLLQMVLYLKICS